MEEDRWLLPGVGVVRMPECERLEEGLLGALCRSQRERTRAASAVVPGMQQRRGVEERDDAEMRSAL